MLFTASAEQIKFFQLNGYLEVENLLDVSHVKQLLEAIDAVCAKSPGYPEENFFRSLEMLPKLIKKNGWGQVAAELLHKKKLRLLSDKFFTATPTTLNVPNEDDCGLLISLKTCSGIFFQNALPNSIFNKEPATSLFLIFTASYLPDVLHPLVVNSPYAKI